MSQFLRHCPTDDKSSVCKPDEKIATVCVRKVEEKEGKESINRARPWLNFWVTPESERETNLHLSVLWALVPQGPYLYDVRTEGGRGGTLKSRHSNKA